MIFQIFCPGKSLFYLGRIPGPRHPRIAVNFAIMAGYEFDVWAMQDPEVLKTCVDRGLAYSPQTSILTHWNFDSAAEKLFGWTEKHRDFYHRHICIHYESLPDHVWMGGNRLWRGYTVFTAIAWAVMCGAEKIQLFGADMKEDEKGYFLEGVENARTNHSNRRWREERELFDVVSETLKRRGVALERF